MSLKRPAISIDQNVAMPSATGLRWVWPSVFARQSGWGRVGRPAIIWAVAVTGVCLLVSLGCDNQKNDSAGGTTGNRVPSASGNQQSGSDTSTSSDTSGDGAATEAAERTLAAADNLRKSGPIPFGDGSAQAADHPVAFVDRTANSGLTHAYENGEAAEINSIIESIGGGLGLFDFDRDGVPDLFLPGGGTFPKFGEIQPKESTVYRGLSGWKFTDVTASSAAATARWFSFGVAIGDVDNDGFPDVLMTGYGGLMFWRNMGDGTFVDAGGDAGFGPVPFATSAAWGDLNGDGNDDLYVAQYVDWTWQNHPACEGTGGIPDVCPPKRFNGLDDMVFLSRGDGTFGRVQAEIGLVSGGKGLGVIAGDVDLDGDLDVYVANDTTENFLYLNSGKGTLSEEGLIQGVALDDHGAANGSMGVDFGDFDLDGAPDIWVANYEKESYGLYQNQRSLGFQHVSRELGIEAIGDVFVGFGTAFGDFDLDGDEDLVVANGHVIQTPRLSPLRQLPLYLQNRTGRFTRQEFPEKSYFGSVHLGRGLTASDIDGDGDLDLAITHNREPTSLMENVTPPQRKPLSIKLVGTGIGQGTSAISRDAVGANVVVYQKHQAGAISTEERQLRLIKGGGSYLSATPTTVFVGYISGANVLRLTVTWPNGTTQELALANGSGENTFGEIASGEYTIVQGRDRVDFRPIWGENGDPSTR